MLGAHRADVATAVVGELREVLLAPLGGRIVAKLADIVIVFLPVYIVVAVAVPDSFLTVLLATQVVLVVYETVLVAKTGATPGKRLARVKVVRVATGRPPGFTHAFIRAISSVPANLVPAVSALFDESTYRGGHDRLAGTVVIAA
ncbi:hypothetical protein ALI144C_32835 [Actinosynnema sp. ALI-1.44]|uniref:RDD family protein n=1 Tax=Actinosynnema sp. ALI-1.44 TaxID=1933779 RepID=UPI00097CAC05|nr:RDD family protein [Actinosynnema sp. ALI-1.44]ONI76915.1 hypothetical protein ALI144C_32835 [Actinosynnema sp. ALI-1.44]